MHFLIPILAGLAAAAPLVDRDIDYAGVLCSGPGANFTIASWKDVDMDTYVASNAAHAPLEKRPNLAWWKSQVSGLNDNDFPCGGADGKCVTATLIKDFCHINPRAVFVLIAIANYLNFLNDISTELLQTIQTVSSASAQFPETFNPNNFTALPGTSAASTASNVLGLVGAFAGLIPGLGLVEETAEVAYSAGSAIAGAASAAAAAGGMGGQGKNVETQFNSFATIQGYLADMSKGVTLGVSKRSDAIVHNIPSDSYPAPPGQISFWDLKDTLHGGGFANPITPDSTNVRETLQAVIAAPGINTLWQYNGVVVVQAGSSDLPSDPCQGDSYLPAEQKMCDQGVMSALVQIPLGQNQYPEGAPFHMKPDGLDQLGKYFLVPGNVMTIAVAQQRDHGVGSAGPSYQDYLSSLTSNPTTNLEIDQLAFFNLPVCHFDKIKTSDIWEKEANLKCHSSSTDQQHACYFLKKMSLCPLQFSPGQFPPTDPFKRQYLPPT